MEKIIIIKFEQCAKNVCPLLVVIDYMDTMSAWSLTTQTQCLRISWTPCLRDRWLRRHNVCGYHGHHVCVIANYTQTQCLRISWTPCQRDHWLRRHNVCGYHGHQVSVITDYADTMSADIMDTMSAWSSSTTRTVYVCI